MVIIEYKMRDNNQPGRGDFLHLREGEVRISCITVKEPGLTLPYRKRAGSGGCSSINRGDVDLPEVQGRIVRDADIADNLRGRDTEYCRIHLNDGRWLPGNALVRTLVQERHGDCTGLEVGAGKGEGDRCVPVPDTGEMAPIPGAGNGLTVNAPGLLLNPPPAVMTYSV